MASYLYQAAVVHTIQNVSTHGGAFGALKNYIGTSEQNSELRCEATGANARVGGGRKLDAWRIPRRVGVHSEAGGQWRRIDSEPIGSNLREHFTGDCHGIDAPAVPSDPS